MKTAAFLFLACGIVHASIIIQVGNNPQPPEFNVLLTNGMTGTAVTGTFNQVPNVNALFTSTQTLLEDASGQALIETANGSPLTNINLQLLTTAGTGLIFGDVIFALNPPNGNVPNPTFTIRANGTSGNAQTLTGTVTTGNQFFTLVASNGEHMTSVNITSSGLEDIRQVRFSDIETVNGVPVPTSGGGEAPEASSLLMLGSGLVALPLLKRKSHSLSF